MNDRFEIKIFNLLVARANGRFAILAVAAIIVFLVLKFR